MPNGRWLQRDARMGVVMILLGFVGGALLLGSAPRKARESGFLLETESEGEVIAGSVEALVDHVSGGGELRVGWELQFSLPQEDAPRVLAHWVDAGFLTVWQGHVFAQIRDIHAQGPVMDRPAIILTSEPHGWGALVGSDGTLQGVFEGAKPETQIVPTRWAARP